MLKLPIYVFVIVSLLFSGKFIYYFWYYQIQVNAVIIFAKIGFYQCTYYFFSIFLDLLKSLLTIKDLPDQEMSNIQQREVTEYIFPKKITKNELWRNSFNFLSNGTCKYFFFILINFKITNDINNYNSRIWQLLKCGNNNLINPIRQYTQPSNGQQQYYQPYPSGQPQYYQPYPSYPQQPYPGQQPNFRGQTNQPQEQQNQPQAQGPDEATKRRNAANLVGVILGRVGDIVRASVDVSHSKSLFIEFIISIEKNVL